MTAYGYGAAQYGRTRRPPVRRPRRWLAGFLSAIVPGLGQLYEGRPGIAFLFLVPTILLLGLLAYLVSTAPTSAFATVLDPTVLLILLVLQGLVLLWRLLAVGSSITDPRLRPFGGRDVLPMMLLLAFVILPHVLLGYATLLLRDTSQQIFTTARAASADSPREALASPPNWSTGERVNVLLLGVDAGQGRSQALTDTIIVASVDPVGESVSMLSVPRDLVDVPLADGGIYRPKINSLIGYAERNPEDFPEQRGNGVRVLAGALSQLLGIPIHYYARVDLAGFVKVVDSLGGVDVRVDRALNAPDYRGYGVRGFVVEPGTHHFSGGEALAYARIRKAAGESDFTRAARQQDVLVAIRDRVVGGGFLGNLGGFFGAVGETLETDLPPDRLPFLAGLMEKIRRGDVYRAVLQTPLVRATSDARGSILVPDRGAILILAEALFPPPGDRPAVPEALRSPAP